MSAHSGKPPCIAGKTRARKTRAKKIRISLSLALAGWLLLGATAVHAQALDMNFQTPKTTHKPSAKPTSTALKPTWRQSAGVPHPVSPDARPSLPAPTTSGAMPLAATVSKTLYLPPEMYGQWSVTGSLMQTNAPEFFSPSVNDIWVLEREGNQVVISNPASGGSASVNVDSVDGDRATFHHTIPAGRNRAVEEIPTITVMGDTLTGQSLNKIMMLKNGDVAREYYGIYQLRAQRINVGRTRFHPEDAASNPQFEIDDIRHQKN
jgi:hypothetical protein